MKLLNAVERGWNRLSSQTNLFRELSSNSTLSNRLILFYSQTIGRLHRTPQRSLFEYSFHIEKIDKIGDPLLKMKNSIPWDKLFKNHLDDAFGKMEKEKSKGPSGL
jgi:hypothetical protein